MPGIVITAKRDRFFAYGSGCDGVDAPRLAKFDSRFDTFGRRLARDGVVNADRDLLGKCAGVKHLDSPSGRHVCRRKLGELNVDAEFVCRIPQKPAIADKDWPAFKQGVGVGCGFERDLGADAGSIADRYADHRPVVIDDRCHYPCRSIAADVSV